MVATMSLTKPPANSKVTPAAAPTKPKRAPLSPSRNDNNAPPPPLPRGPISKNIVASRYLTSTPSSNFDTKTMTSSSSSSSSTTTSSSSNSLYTPRKRDQSVERRYSGNVTKSSIRSLSVSFQGESFALPVSKVSNPINNNVSRGTYEKKKARGTPTRSSTRSKNKGSFMTMSVDFESEKMKMRTSEAIKELRKSLTADIECDSDDSDHGISDNVRGGGPRAIVVPARFWQETINLLKRVQTDPVSVSSPPLLRNSSSTKVMSGSKALDNGPKISKTRNGVGCTNNLGNMPSILSFPTTVDARRGKVAEKKLDDAHVLRMLHNKHLQWRFANARAEAATAAQQAATQKRLYNAWVTISKLWNSVISKRTAIQQMKMNLKLHSVLKKQISYLDNWDLTEGDHAISLAGVITALESSSLCLPVLSGAKTDIPNLKHAICSAVDVMEAMAISVSIHSLVTKVEHVNSLASELASATKIECSLLDQCKDLFSALTLLEMQDCSIRAHTLQLIPSTTMSQW
uniref:QWRF motif-containing protein 2-like n=1 Tax=Erigeron canadensis TaxID=72917 RepID=UPI001CB8AEEA|nr:QWRF motif-containing protein 2-like [Erigeron canadensis]